MNNNSSLAVLIHLKSKLHKWKNIAILAIIFSILLIFKLIFFPSFNSQIIEENFIASINIDGVIFEDNYREKILLEIAKSKAVKAVIVNIDSQGGGIVGSEILYNNLREIAKEKPTVILLKSVAASGGYMAAIAGDYIIAHNGTLTGSIGVLMESPEITELAKKIGIKLNSYKSSPLKGSPSPFEKPSPQVDLVMQEAINDSHKFFSDLVKMRRAEKLNKQNLTKIFDGRIFTGRQALEVGLVDKIGNKKDALEYLKSQNIDTEKLPIKEIEIIENKKRFFDKFFSLLPFIGAAKLENKQEIMAIMP
jgi:protease-4